MKKRYSNNILERVRENPGEEPIENDVDDDYNTVSYQLPHKRWHIK